MKTTTLEERLTELVGTRLTKEEKRRLEAVVTLKNTSNTQLLGEAVNNLVYQYLLSEA